MDLKLSKELEDAKSVLRNAGYAVDTLWSIEDVTNRVKHNFTDTELMSILEVALTDEEVTRDIFEIIEIESENVHNAD